MSDDFFDPRGPRAARRRLRRAQRRRRAVALLTLLVGSVAVIVAAVSWDDGRDGRASASSPASSAGIAADLAGAGKASSAPPAAAVSASPASPASAPPAPASPPAAAVPSPAAPPLRKPTKADPLRVYFGGDSLSGLPGILFANRGSETRLMTVSTDYQVSSRLATTYPVDWPARLRTQMAGRRYDAGVFMIGINDPGMPMTVDGRSTGYPSKAWLTEYRRRADGLIQTMLRYGVERVYWLGLPPMPRQSQTDQVKRLNQLFETLARRHPEVVYVDTYTPLATKSGAFDASLRSGDGIHFTNEGAGRIAAAVWDAMKADWQTPRAVVSPQVLRWRGSALPERD